MKAEYTSQKEVRTPSCHRVRYTRAGYAGSGCTTLDPPWQEGVRTQKGFTLPELLVAGLVFAVLLSVAAFFIHPNDYSAARRDAERWTEVARIARALKAYAADNKRVLPASITSKAVPIGSDDGMVDLCNLVPKYLPDVPLDPAFELKKGYHVCGNDGTPYSAGYAVERTSDNKLTIYAPLGEEDENISLTVPY